MTFIARLELDEATARAVAEAASEDADLGWPSVGLSEMAPGRWSVEVYFAKTPDAAEAAALARIAGTSGRFAVSELPDTDWVSKSLEGLRPVRAGRFVIHGRHDRAAVRTNEIAIEIEANEAFGTGHHGTTAGCLREIDRLAKIRAFRRPLDVGTGTGVLAIAMAQLWHVPVLATDIDPVAVRVARANARLNGSPEVEAIVAGGLATRLVRERGHFDLIVANILAGPLQALALSVRQALAPDGFVVLSGLLPTQGARIVAAYRSVCLTLLRAATLDGWLTLTFIRGKQRRNSQSQSAAGLPHRRRHRPA
jgi:ribosomal protein L11 methyltransferase